MSDSRVIPVAEFQPFGDTKFNRLWYKIEVFQIFLCHTILKWNDYEPTRFGLIFAKQTFLNMTYMKSTNDKNCAFCKKSTQFF